MLFNSEFYELYVNTFEKSIKDMFGTDMKQRVKTCAFQHMGSFILSYEYVPLNYIITIENEMRTFNVTIEDKEKASTPLSRIKKYESGLSQDNIHEVICFLKEVLRENDFDLYIYKDDKVYIKNKQGVKRIKRVKRSQ